MDQWESLQEDRRREREAEELNKRDAAVDEREGRREDRETVLLRVAVASAIVAILAAGAAVWQGYESHQARKDAQTDFETTRKDAAASAAQARQDALDTIQKQLDAQHELRDQAARSADTAQKALAARGTQFRIDQRPYLTLEDTRFDPQIENNHSPATLKLAFHNAGRTPALKVTYFLRVFVDGRQTAEMPSDFPAELTIATERNVETSISIWFQGPGDFEGITGGTRKLSLTGELTYRDVFRQAHKTTFCTIYDAKVTKKWLYCQGNDVE